MTRTGPHSPWSHDDDLRSEKYMIIRRFGHRPLAFMQLAAGAALLALAFPGVGLAAGPTAPPLGTAASFGVLAGTTVTNVLTPPSPNTVVNNANVGVSPGTAVTGFLPPGQVNGAGGIHTGSDAVAVQAQSDLTTAYNDAANPSLTPCPGGNNLTGQDLGGKVLVPGVYCFTSSAQLTGALTLNGGPADVWVFQIVSTLTTASASVVNLVGGASGCNVYWQVGSSATVGTGSAFVGNILALTDIALQTGATLEPGRALARNGEVTLDHNTISPTDCAAGGSTTGGTTTGTTGGTTGGITGGLGATPELDSLLLFGAGALGLAGYARTRFTARRRREDSD